MDVILPYVAWITLLAYLTDLGLKQISRRLFPWYHASSRRARHEHHPASPSATCGRSTATRWCWSASTCTVSVGRVLHHRRGLGLRQDHLPAPAAGGGGPSRGEILLDGQPLRPEPGPDRGIVFQRYSVFPHLTVLRNVLLGLELGGAA
jgi:hypothetical protein